MKKIYTLAILCAFMILSTGFAGAREWFLFKAGSYEIAFPAKPTSQTRSMPSQMGELKLDINMYEAPKSGKEDDNLIYMTNITEFPAEMVSSDKKEALPALFRGAIDGAVKNVEGKLLAESEIELAGFPGREFKVDFKNGLAIIKARCYLVKNRMYVVQVITKTEKFPNESLEKFFSSFRVNAGG